MTLDLSRIALGAFDMDGTLYEYIEGFTGALRSAQAAELVKISQGKVTHEAAIAQCTHLYQTQGSIWNGLSSLYGTTVAHIHKLFHEAAPVTFVEPTSGLRDSFIAAAQTGFVSAVITHSDMNYTARVLAKLDISDQFDPRHIITLEQVDFREKDKDDAMFMEVNRRTGIPAAQTIVAEDTIRNMVRAKDMGKATAYIHWGRPLDVLPSHVDCQFPTPAALLRAVADARKACKPR